MDLWLWLLALAAACAAGWRVFRRRDRARHLMLLCHRAGLEFSPIDPFPVIARNGGIEVTTGTAPQAHASSSA